MIIPRQLGVWAALLCAVLPLRADTPPVTYLGLADKGLSGAEVAKSKRPFSAARPRPPVRYLPQGPSPERKGSARRDRTPVTLVERHSVARSQADITFGFPFSKGALYNLQKLRLLDAEEQEVPMQSTALALWPDGSIKSALIQARADFSPSQEKQLVVEFGEEVSKASMTRQSPLTVRKAAHGYTISTGVISVEIGTDRFVPFKSIINAKGHLVAKGGAFELVGEDGTLFSSALGKPELVSIEREGPLDVVLRVEGKYHSASGASFMRYIARLRFHAGSSRVDLTLTHINDELETEFSDFASLALHLDMQGGASPYTATLHGTPAEPRGEEGTVSLTQWGSDTSDVNGTPSTQRASGVVTLLPAATNTTATSTTGNTGVQLAIRHFWQRWPKGIEANSQQLQVQLLPKLPSTAFGEKLPFHLAFPFVEGFYRLKWGMAFTERLSFNFSATEPAAQLEAEVNMPITALLPPAYVASTGVFGPVHTPKEWPLKKAWHDFMAGGLENYYAQREAHKEYGHLSFGDWFGERGRNWGNNEYDIPHGFFAHFLAGGEPRFFDEAMNGARHQADSDIVHAYPDPFYIGANLQHSIGHSGISYQRVTPTWSYKYDGATSAGSGHTWSDGMADCWLLTGDPVVMESLLALGEHIRWAFVPSFKTLAALERTGGWSIQAALAAYRATSDPAYLEAADAIATLAIKEQDPASGVWPHELPPAHAGNKTGMFGNSNFNIGILLMGLSKYHAETQRPEVLEALQRALPWVERSWMEEGGWSYSSDAEGRPLRGRPSINLNPLIYPCLAYVGLVSDNPRWVKLCEKAIASMLEHEGPKLPGSPVKEYSIKGYATTETFGWLDLAREATPSKTKPASPDTPDALDTSTSNQKKP